VAVVVGTLVLAATWSSQVQSLEHERQSWGETSQVGVVVEPIALGQPLGDAVVLQDVPVAMVPSTAVLTIDRAALAKTDLFPGELLIRERISGGEDVLPEGTVGMALSVAAGSPLIEVGDLIDVWSVDAANFSSHRLGHQVQVLAMDDSEITVAIPVGEVEAVTVASLRPVVVTLVG